MSLKKLLTIFFVLCCASHNASAISTPWQENKQTNSQARLISSFYKAEDGSKKLIAALHFKIAQGWKIYGDDKSAGIDDGIGVAPNFDFSKSSNVAKTHILWPNPEIGFEEIGSSKLRFSYYQNEVIIPIEIKALNPRVATKLVVKVDYGICKEVCVPVSENFSLKITDEIDDADLQQIQPFLSDKTITKSASVKAETTAVSGSQGTAMKGLFSLVHVILLGILGGIILNIMPCVLPVISIKLLSIIHATESYRQKHQILQPFLIRLAFLSTIAGILSCFAIFAGIAGLIKLTGNELGWGFQFQNPHFLTFLIIILTIFSANLMGFFEFSFDRFINNFLVRKISEMENRQEEVRRKSIFIINFLSGILAVILATPCSAPFLGTAISFALANNFLVILLVFLSIGVGFSAPYIAVIISPKLINFLPKPGNWMIQLKKFLTLMIIATILWLIHVLSTTIGLKADLLIIAGSILLIFSFKIRLNVVRYFSIFTLIAVIFSISFISRNNANVYEGSWQKFDEVEINHQVALGNVVFVDITADWCITCKFNKARTLQNQEVIDKFQDRKIVMMRGDITKPNPQIMKFMQKHNRFAIPFNAVYGPKAPQGLLTSEILNKKEIFQLIDQATKEKK